MTKYHPTFRKKCIVFMASFSLARIRRDIFENKNQETGKKFCRGYKKRKKGIGNESKEEEMRGRDRRGWGVRERKRE